MDPIHPIVPITPGIGPMNPLPSTRRVDPDSQREHGRDARRGDKRQNARRGPAPEADGPDRPDEALRVDITA